MKPDIKQNIAQLKREVAPYGAEIVLITKKRTAGEIRRAYDAGLQVFGENRAQELEEKHALLPTDVDWHFVGHLQTNKVGLVVPYVSTIHSADRPKLIRSVNKEASRLNRKVNLLLQLHIAKEPSKHGFTLEALREWLDLGEWREMNNICISGVMGMATLTDNNDQIRSEFRQLRSQFESIRNEYFAGISSFCEVSMGMSGDYKIALEEGSTMIRVGQAVFGPRPE